MYTIKYTFLPLKSKVTEKIIAVTYNKLVDNLRINLATKPYPYDCTIQKLLM